MNEAQDLSILSSSEQCTNLFEFDIQDISDKSENPISLNTINLV
jgi:hypothetical protein